MFLSRPSWSTSRESNLDGVSFLRNLRSARRGAAGGPSGVTVEHVQPLLDHNKDAKLFCQVGGIPFQSAGSCFGSRRHQVGQADREKPDGGVRGIVAGDVVRRLVARTMSQQLMDVERATAPFQYAFSTRAGCESLHTCCRGSPIWTLEPR